MSISNVYYENCGGGDEQYTPYYAVEIIIPYIQHAFFLPANIISDSVLNDIFGDMSQMTCLVPDKRTRFFNAEKKATGKQPTFKAIYIGKNFFEKQIIGVTIPKNIDLNSFHKNLELF